MGPRVNWKKLGKLSRAMKFCCWYIVCFALMMWIFAADWIEPALAALLVIVLMLWTGVLSWSDITNNKAAWNTFVWFTSPGGTGRYSLSSTGFIAWLGKEGGALMSGISPGMATIVLLLAFYLLHYLFASTTAHTTALLPAMLTIASTIPGMNMEVFVLLMVTSLGVMGIITRPRYWPKPNLLRQRLPADQRLLAPRHHLWRHLPGRPAADWLSVDVHDVLIHNRRDYPGGFYLCGVSDYVDLNRLFIRIRFRWRTTIRNTICSAKSTSPSPNLTAAAGPESRGRRR